MRSRFAVIPVCLLALLATMFLPAAPARADEKLELSFQDEMPMEEFLRTVSRMTDTQMVWNPSDKNIRGKKIIGGVNLSGDRATFFKLVRGLLTFYELVIIPVGPTDNNVMLVMDARQTSSILKLKPRYVVLNDGNLGTYENSDGLYITTTIEVEHMKDLRNARNALTRIVTGQNIGNVTEVPASNSFVVTDFAPNVVAIYRLLREMDKPGSGSSTTAGRTEAITLQHANAQEMAEVLGNHFRAPQAGPPSRNATPARPSAPRITADSRTNKLLVTGTDAEIARVKSAIALLDVKVHDAPQGAFVVRLTHINAAEAASVLSSLMVGSKLWMTDGPNPATARIVAHETRNALIIRASRAAYDEIRQVIAEMDTKEDDAGGEDK